MPARSREKERPRGCFHAPSRVRYTRAPTITHRTNNRGYAEHERRSGRIRFHCLRSGARGRTSPDAPATRRSLASLCTTACRRGDFFFTPSPTFVINALGPSSSWADRGEGANGTALFSKRVASYSRGTHASMRMIGSEGAESDTAKPRRGSVNYIAAVTNAGGLQGGSRVD